MYFSGVGSANARQTHESPVNNLGFFPFFSPIATVSGGRKQYQHAVTHNRARPMSRDREAHFGVHSSAFVLMRSLSKVVALHFLRAFH